MKISVINGPNLNLLGIRETDLYGPHDYPALERFIREVCAENGIEVEIFQSNHEGALIDRIHAARLTAEAIIINPAAYTHTSIALLDALKAVGLPAVEAHLTDIAAREPFRHTSYVGMACVRSFTGQGFDSYRAAIEFLVEFVFHD